MTDADVVVIGAGVMGSATARALARRGREVILLERFRIGHTRGSSHGRSRIFRLSYDHPQYVRMAMESLPLWRELEEEAGTDILRRTGGLDVGSIDANVRALQQCGGRFEVLAPDRAAERFPFLAFPEDRVLFHDDAGIVLADRAVRELAGSARRHGARVVEQAEAIAVVPGDDAVEIRTADRTFRAGVAVVAAGGWANALLSSAGIRLPVRVTRETVAYFRTPDEERLPTRISWGEGLGMYALPSPGQGLKVGEHGVGPEVDPDIEGPPNAESVARIASWVAERYPTADPEPYLAETCLYTNTRDGHFILERRNRVVIGSPCSGHGFKFAPWIGERLAALATEP
ncbi:MAG TPA: FAD-dependent oxidoreductase [Actinomycetota bacterium]|nr:FAD-dependent oxidoreductase [Actinomycetota bacterium]